MKVILGVLGALLAHLVEIMVFALGCELMMSAQAQLEYLFIEIEQSDFNDSYYTTLA